MLKINKEIRINKGKGRCNMLRINKKRVTAILTAVLMIITMSAAYPANIFGEAAGASSVIDSGRFDDGNVDGVTIPGAQWRLYGDGTLRVDSGFINWGWPS